ncbi:MAG: sugar ABC transporter substrate-binding protein [Chloroflexales bacterium]|nr:sugar ABC transporter substrate-binding protein [Chloroflexales bacterium]
MRHFTWISLCTLIATLCVACSPSSPAAAQQISFMVFGDAAEKTAYEQLVSSFHAAQSDIRVNLTHIPSPSDYRTRLVTEFAAGTPPDISLMNYRRFGSFAASDLLEPIGPFLDASELISKEDFYSAPIESFTWEGMLTCLPQNISSLVVYYNRDLFDAAGLDYPADQWTWGDFLQTAQTLTRDTDGDGVIDQYGLGVEASLFRLAPFVWQNGGVIVDDTDLPSRLTLTRPPSLEALSWFVDLQQVHGVVPDRVAEAAMDSESRFVAGTTAMYLNSRRGTPSYREITGFSWDVAPLPQGKQKAGILHSDGYCLARTTANKEAAWTFIEYANSPEGQRLVSSSGRIVPSLILVAESEAFLDPAQPPSRSYVFLEGVPYLQRVPLLNAWEEIEKIASEEIERAFYGDISVQEAATLAVQRTEEYFLVSR